MTKAPRVAALALIVACGGSDKKPAQPDNLGGGPIDATPVETANPAGDVLTIAPFVLTITGTKQDGTRQVRVIRGSADGVISMEKNGETTEVVRVSADGAFTPLIESRVDVIKMDASGVLHQGATPLPGRVGEDGTLYGPDDAVILKIEGGVVIGVADGVMTSTVKANGKVLAETTYEMTVEGGDEIRRLAAAILLLQMTAGPQSDDGEVGAPEATSPARP